MLTADFDYVLPPEAIAQEPLPRGQSRLLVLDDQGPGRHRRIDDLEQILRPDDLLVVNDTQVIPARLFGHRPRGGRVEILLTEKLDDLKWRALARPGRRLPLGTRVILAPDLEAEVVGTLVDGKRDFRFSSPIEGRLDELGHVPLPPYIVRADTASDRRSYQTVFARHAGAVAAPTAGLHFSEALLVRLAEKGISRAAVTLHVGPGTFKPVSAARVFDHVMDEERYSIDEETVAAIVAAKARGSRIVAIGTTVVRTLEGNAAANGGKLVAGAGRTRIFIKPGDRFQIVDMLLTNFHLPKSSLLMLVSAFAGRERVLSAYQEAVNAGYRFYSYGDAMLLEHHPGACPLIRSGGSSSAGTRPRPRD